MITAGYPWADGAGRDGQTLAASFLHLWWPETWRDGATVVQLWEQLHVVYALERLWAVGVASDSHSQSNDVLRRCRN